MTTSAQVGSERRELRVEKVEVYPSWLRWPANPEQLRELTEAAKRTGTVDPPVEVFRRRQKRWRYYVLKGELRLWAARAAGLKTIPVVLRRVASEEEGKRDWLVDRLRTERMSPVERAVAYQSLVNMGAKPSEFAKLAVTTEPEISFTRGLLKLPHEAQWLIEGGALSAHHGRTLTLFAEWRKTLVWLATEAAVNGWNCERLEQIRPRDYGLKKGMPEPAEIPEPGEPPFGAAWRRLALRKWVVGEMEGWLGRPGMGASGVAYIAAMMVEFVGVQAGLDAVGWLAPSREEEAQALEGEVEEEIEMTENWRRYGKFVTKGETLAERRREAIRHVWERWLRRVGESDLKLAWRIGKECYLRYEPFEEAPGWPPPGLVKVKGERSVV